jgi:DNA invertase Pin-like site-specific DNA recombinase
MSKLVSYVRVSTQRQGASGLGLDAQRAAVAAYAAANGHTIVMEVQEVESGKRCDRPQLARAIALTRIHGAVLCVAKLDRLARDLAFIACLMRDKVPFVACDQPFASEMTIGILAAVAQAEAKAISERTRVALAQAKLRGVQLGGSRNHTLTADDRAKGSALGGQVRKRKAAERAAAIMPIIAELRGMGCNSLAALATGLNRLGIPTATGCATWHPATVRNALRSA